MEAPIKTQTKKEAGRVRVHCATDIWRTFLRMQNDVAGFGCADCRGMIAPHFMVEMSLHSWCFCLIRCRSSQPKVQAKSVWVGKVILSSLLSVSSDRNGCKISEHFPRHCVLWSCPINLWGLHQLFVLLAMNVADVVTFPKGSSWISKKNEMPTIKPMLLWGGKGANRKRLGEEQGQNKGGAMDFRYLSTQLHFVGFTDISSRCKERSKNPEPKDQSAHIQRTGLDNWSQGKRILWINRGCFQPMAAGKHETRGWTYHQLCWSFNGFRETYT